MNRDNLKRMADHLKNNVKQESFDARGYIAGKDDFSDPVCGSTGRPVEKVIDMRLNCITDDSGSEHYVYCMN